MAKRLSPQEVERLKRQEKLVAELKKILYQNYTYAIQLPEVRKAIEQGNEDFSFFKNKIAERELRKFLLRNSEAINITIINAIKEEWQYVNDNHWNGMRTVFSKDYQKLKVYEAAKNNAENYVRNTAAENLKFVTQTRQGVKFSDRVWNISDKVIPEMDILVQNAIKEGKSAAELGRELRKFLNEPERIFRRVRNKKTGELELSETAKQYHPGQGVYRSSVKNAERLARTEINVAYRYSEWLAYQSNELIIGYEIKVSNNPENRCQTCVDLQGIYPKWFLWTGWHPQCRCRMIPVTLNEADLRAKYRSILLGTDFKPKQIVDLPENFKTYLRDNAERIANAKSTPYWYQDNEDRIKKALNE